MRRLRDGLESSGLARSKIEDEDEYDYSEGRRVRERIKEDSKVARGLIARLIVTRTVALVPFRIILLVLVLDFDRARNGAKLRSV
jgi:hypothetical protein